MMSATSRPTVQLSVRRLIMLTVGLAPIVAIVLSGWLWLESRIPEWVFWKAGLVFLLATLVAYRLTAATALLGTAVLTWLVLRKQGAWPGRPALARWLLLCVSLVLGIAVAEAASAVWQQRLHRATAMPAGGLRRGVAWVPPTRLPEAPEAIALRTDFPDRPGDRAIDLVMLGESSAEGVPYSRWVSISAILAWQVSAAIPKRPVRLRVLARAGHNLEAQHWELSNLPYRPDLLLVYCGHNEFSTRLSDWRELDYYGNTPLPGAWNILIDRLEGVSPLCGLIRETADKCRVAIPPAAHGRRTLVDVPVYTPVELNVLLADFRRRLEMIVAYAERVGACPVLIVPAANDAGFEPNRSFLPATASAGEREAFRRDFLAARRLEAGSSDLDGSIARYRALLARQPGFAETHYRLAQLLERNEAWDEAYRHYVAARDLDGNPIRCPSAFQEVYREVAARHGCILIDSQSYFHTIGRHGLLDDELFQDAMHPSLRGQIALAQAVLVALHARRALGWPPGSPVPRIEPAACAAHFGLGMEAWKAICLWGITFNVLAAPLRYDPSWRLQQQEASAAAAERIAAGAAPEALGLPNIGIPAPVPIVSLYFTNSISW